MIDILHPHWSASLVLEKELRHRESLRNYFRFSHQDTDFNEQVIKSIKRAIELLKNDKDFK